MKRVSLIGCIMLLISQMAYSESDQEILETVRANGTRVFLEQASWTLPESFNKSGLAPSDKERLIQQWANASADCMVDALAKYAESTGVPLSEMVNDDGSFSLKGDGSSSEFNLNVETCIERGRVWEPDCRNDSNAHPTMSAYGRKRQFTWFELECRLLTLNRHPPQGAATSMKFRFFSSVTGLAIIIVAAIRPRILSP